MFYLPVRAVYFFLVCGGTLERKCSAEFLHKHQRSDMRWLTGRNSLLVRAPDSRSKGCEIESRQERRGNFLLQSQLCLLIHILCPFHPRVTAVARKRPRSFYQKCRWQVTLKHAHTLDPAKSKWADYAAVQT